VAWAEAVVLCGEMLKDVDGKLPPATGREPLRGSNWSPRAISEPEPPHPATIDPTMAQTKKSPAR
jgi:hypothetical protein